MKKLWTEILMAAFFGLVVPWMILNAFTFQIQNHTETTAPTQRVPAVQKFMIPILMSDGSTLTMELDSYITCVVLGEMPPSFEPEAQKAQAVVARTYALRAYESGAKHPGGAVCTDPSCCQGYRSKEDFLAQGGTETEYNQINAIVHSTSGQVLIYGGELIEATYFSSSGGRTEDALAVWGSDVPYLRSTESPEEAYMEKILATVTFTAKEFSDALGVTLSGPPASWLGSVTYTSGGGIDTMVIGGVAYKGTTLRQLLKLRSTAFTMTAVGDHITVTTKGHGHRVGMSQYGAEAMAVQGSTYQQILAHYYQGTTLTDWIDNTVDLG